MKSGFVEDLISAVRCLHWPCAVLNLDIIGFINQTIWYERVSGWNPGIPECACNRLLKGRVVEPPAEIPRVSRDVSAAGPKLTPNCVGNFSTMASPPREEALPRRIMEEG